MEKISLHNTLPAVFADREKTPSQVWQQELCFERGNSYLVAAESGTGKSSLCSYIYGYRIDYSGSIFFDNDDIRKLTVGQWCEIRKRHIAYLPQEMRLFGELTAIENIELKNRLTGLKSKKEIADMFEMLGIADKMQQKAALLSIGQQQRVALIRTLCQPADFIILDEPVSHLDEQNNAVAAQLVSEHAKAFGAAVIATSVGNHLQIPFDQELKL